MKKHGQQNTGTKNTTGIPLNEATATEAANISAIHVSDVDAFFILLVARLVSMYNAGKFSAGVALETLKYSILFSCMKENGFGLARWGSSDKVSEKMKARPDFPQVVAGVKLLSDVSVYSKLSKLHVEIGNGRYIHYVSNAFHVFDGETINGATQYLPKEKEKVVIKLNVKTETEKPDTGETK